MFLDTRVFFPKGGNVGQYVIFDAQKKPSYPPAPATGLGGGPWSARSGAHCLAHPQQQTGDEENVFYEPTFF